MHILVCLKYIPDPEAPWVQYMVDGTAHCVTAMPGVRWLVSPFDEQALEVALRIREAVGAARITVLTMGPEPFRGAIKHGLAMGADDGVHLCDPVFEAGDVWTTARVISAALRKLETPELVLTGRQAADWDNGVVGSAIAELMDWPVVSYAAHVMTQPGAVQVTRVVEDGVDTVWAPLPAVVTVSNEVGKPRIPSLRETMRAARKPTLVWRFDDLELKQADLVTRRRCRSLNQLPSGVVCEYLGGVTVYEQAEALVQRLRTAQLI
jgi:electron transfer flavoprotein beta subunit